MGFAVPVFAVHGDSDAAQQIGWVLGVKEVASELFARLRQPGMVWQSAEAVLVRRAGATVEYLSPLLDGGKPLARALAMDTPGLAALWTLPVVGESGPRRVLQRSSGLARIPAGLGAAPGLCGRIPAHSAKVH